MCAAHNTLALLVIPQTHAEVNWQVGFQHCGSIHPKLHLLTFSMSQHFHT